MNIDEIFTKIQSAEDTIILNKTRAIKTVTYADKLIDACLQASTGEEEKKIFGGLKTIADKLLTILS